MVDMIRSDRAEHKRKMPDVIVTRLSLPATSLRIAGVALVLFLIWNLVLHFPRPLAGSDAFWTLVILIFTPVMSWSEGVILRHMFLRGTLAVWIEDGRLKFIDDTSFRRRFRSLDMADIQDLSSDRYYMPNFPWGLPCVRVRMKDGSDGGTILTLYFTDTAEIVRARLAEALSLPKPA